jgi:hypothetical protein
LAIHQCAILKLGDSGRLISAGRSQSYHLEGVVAMAHYVQQGLRVSTLRLTGNGDFARPRKAIRQCPEPLPQVAGIQGHRLPNSGGGWRTYSPSSVVSRTVMLSKKKAPSTSSGLLLTRPYRETGDELHPGGLTNQGSAQLVVRRMSR